MFDTLYPDRSAAGHLDGSFCLQLSVGDNLLASYMLLEADEIQLHKQRLRLRTAPGREDHFEFEPVRSWMAKV